MYFVFEIRVFNVKIIFSLKITFINDIFVCLFVLFGGTFKIMPNFCRHRATASENIAIHFIGKIKRLIVIM